MRGKKIETSKDFRQLAAVVLIGLLLFLIAKIGFTKPIYQVFENVSVPLQTSFHQTSKSIGNFFETIIQIGSLRQENSSLVLENEKLKAENNALKMLKVENESLRSQLKTTNPGLKIINTAHPIGNGAVGVKNVLLIDQGSLGKVEKGDLVLVGNILLGEIISTSAHLSNVQLLSDPDTKIPAITDSLAEGIVQGEFGAGIKLTDVVQEKVLSKGEYVKTSGRNSWPRGLIIGKIEKVNKVEKDFFQSAQIQPILDLSDLSLVYIARF